MESNPRWHPFHPSCKIKVCPYWTRGTGCSWHPWMIQVFYPRMWWPDCGCRSTTAFESTQWPQAQGYKKPSPLQLERKNSDSRSHTFRQETSCHRRPVPAPGWWPKQQASATWWCPYHIWTLWHKPLEGYPQWTQDSRLKLLCNYWQQYHDIIIHVAAAHAMDDMQAVTWEFKRQQPVTRSCLSSSRQSKMTCLIADHNYHPSSDNTTTFVKNYRPQTEWYSVRIE